MTAAVDPALIDLLLEAQVLRFGEFVTKSGRPTPYFANFGDVRTGAQIATLGRCYADRIVATHGDAVDVIFGPAYKGIPLAVATASALATHHGLDVGFCFDRKEVKDHGEGGVLVGQVPADGDRVVIVEDVTTAGTSIRETVPKLRAGGDVEVVGLVIGLDRQERGPQGEGTALQELAREFGLVTTSLATITEVAAELRTRGVLSEGDAARIAAHLREHGARTS